MGLIKYINSLRPLKRAEEDYDILIKDMDADLDAHESQSKRIQKEIEAENKSLDSEIKILDSRVDLARSTGDKKSIDESERALNKLKKRLERTKNKVAELEDLNIAFKKKYDVSNEKMEKITSRISKWIIVDFFLLNALIIGVCSYLSTVLTGEFVNGVHISYYEALAQIFPVVLIALFIGTVPTQAPKNTSTWSLLTQGNKFIGLLPFAIGELACLITLGTQTSTTLALNATAVSIGALCVLVYIRVVHGTLEP
jgi:hypothetical protein